MAGVTVSLFAKVNFNLISGNCFHFFTLEEEEEDGQKAGD